MTFPASSCLILVSMGNTSPLSGISCARTVSRFSGRNVTRPAALYRREVEIESNI